MPAGGLPRVGIIGGGLGGLALARALQQLGAAEVVVFERWGALKSRGGAITIQQGFRVLEGLGLGDEVLRSCVRLRNACYSSDGRVIWDVALPPSVTCLLCTREDIQRVLAASLAPGTLHLGAAVADVRAGTDEAVIDFADGTTRAFDLVVGADGIHSTVAAKVFGERPAVFAGYSITVAMAREAAPDSPTQRRPATAHQQFHPGAGGARVALATTGEGAGRWHHVNITERCAVPCSGDWDAAGVRDDMFRVLDQIPGSAPLRDTVAASDRIFRWGVWHHPPRPTWVAPGGRVVLLGDAAHAATPFLGQGANYALEDARALADALAAAPPPRAVIAYERARKGACEQMAGDACVLGRMLTAAGTAAAVRDRCFPAYMKAKHVRQMVPAPLRPLCSAVVVAIALLFRLAEAFDTILSFRSKS